VVSLGGTDGEVLGEGGEEGEGTGVGGNGGGDAVVCVDDVWAV
jgi:hypothetical protein